MTQPATDIWALPEERVYEALGTSPKGLGTTEAAARLQQHGQNVLPTKVGRPIIFKFLDQFTSLFAIMLEVAAVLVFIAAMLSTGDSRQDNINVTIAIIGVVLLNATIGFFQEYKAEKATEALQKLVPANAKVIRDGTVAARPRVAGTATGQKLSCAGPSGSPHVPPSSPAHPRATPGAPSRRDPAVHAP